MHYVVTNPTPARRLGIAPGELRDFTHDEMKRAAVSVARAMSPVGQRLVSYVDASGQPATKTEMGPVPGALRIHCFAVDEGEKTEIDGKSLLEIYAEDIKANAAAKRAAYEQRKAERRSR